MKSRSLLSVLAVGTILPALVFGFGVSAAQAVTSDATTETIINSSLEGLGTEVTDPTLLDELQQDISDAVEQGIIDPAIVDAADQTTPEATPAPDPTTDPALSDLIDENLTEQTEVWEEEAPAWAAAFEQIRSDFEACRTDGQSTSTCARTLGFQLQIAHAQAELTNLDAAIAAVADLPEDQQVTALAELEAQRAELEARLNRATAKLDAAVVAGIPGANAEVQARLNSVVGEVRGRAHTPTLPEQEQQNSQSGSSNSGSITIPEVSNGDNSGVSGSQNSSGSGKPSNPGSQGKGNSGKSNH
ncbi:hypothetical protein [Aurantimicrobium minutum]|uniref:hypothetical protein n=1 Tax=Aurantimicrobium minutum TaxID=708131 RepID=UPI00247571C7|nr:hypothetical protein [Aurantimicrobium minutum]MDH6423315.1 hypothetical protein [Aurantimicrobium minutum]